jgi:hypothetical protein
MALVWCVSARLDARLVSAVVSVSGRRRGTGARGRGRPLSYCHKHSHSDTQQILLQHPWRPRHV